jgi:hypothetical protein
MYNFSDWNSIDLHIHSIKSNTVKPNDYDGTKYNAEQLLDVLTDTANSINIFSITDHNCVNTELYNEIDRLILTDKYKNKINYVIGVELDIFDQSIHNDVFHCLCFFDSRDLVKIETAVNKLFNDVELVDRNKKEVYPNMQWVFKTFASNGIRDILLIPHFNNKSKGLPQDIAIENLNYLCFNAYEDSNNIENIQNSLNIYLENGFDNFPFAVFSDNHNLQIYPLDKNNGANDIKCFILGNIKEPFNSIKTAFQEARLRVSLSGIDNMRGTMYPVRYLKEIIINGSPLKLSPYQNTIIGKFGSGKSLLLEKIKHGNESLLSDKYKDFYDQDQNFKVIVGDQTVSSLDEIGTTIEKFKIYEFIQQENYYYKNSLTIDEAKRLFKQLNINHTFNAGIIYDFNKEKLIQSFELINNKVTKTDGKNNLSYGRAFDIQNYYSFPIIFESSDYDSLLESLNEFSDSYDILNSLAIGNVLIFSPEDIQQINKVNDIINSKIVLLNKIKTTDFEKDIQEELKKYNSEYINNNAKDIKNELIKDLDSFYESLLDFSKECVIFEHKFKVENYNNCIKENFEDLEGIYGISWKYYTDKEYKSVTSYVIKETNRKDSFFKSVLSTITNRENSFSNNKPFNEQVQKYNDYANTLFLKTNIQYDILCNNESMLKKSAGEKSSMFIKLIFDLIEKDLSKSINILMILDQPEDNIDNDNIYKQIADRVKGLKLKYNNFQSLIVTHNANVGITADSENIIIAKEILNADSSKQFLYEPGCIENKSFIKEVCDILEGGKKAMERRTIKYGINIIRKVEANEV